MNLFIRYDDPTSKTTDGRTALYHNMSDQRRTFKKEKIGK